MKVLSYRAMWLVKKNQNIEHAEEVVNPERAIVGYTTKEHLLLDLDKSRSLFATERLVRMIQKDYPEVGDCLISQSSYDGFHCIFDNRLSWSRIMAISRTLTGLGIVNRNFTKVRSFREDLTLRISSIDRGREKSEAPKPAEIISATGNYLNSVDFFMFKCKRSFSGIWEYLTCLSAFREIQPIPIN
jgi:hypothetical protein